MRAALLALALAAPAAAQQRPGQPSPPLGEARPPADRTAPEREHVQLEIGPSYDEGDVGSSVPARADPPAPRPAHRHGAAPAWRRCPRQPCHPVGGAARADGHPGDNAG